MIYMYSIYAYLTLTKQKSLFNKTAFHLEDSFKATSEATVCLDQMFVIHVDLRVYNARFQHVFCIVRC